MSRLGMRIALAGLLAGVILAAIPTHHTYPAGLGAKGAGYVDEQTVSCGNLFLAKNPEVRGHDNECDHEYNRRFVLAFGVTAAGVLLGGIAFAISRARGSSSTQSVR